MSGSWQAEKDERHGHFESRVHMHAVVRGWFLLQRHEQSVHVLAGREIDYGVVPGRRDYVHR